MSEALRPSPDPAPTALDGADLPGLYRALLLPRLVEEKMLRLLRQGRLARWFSGIAPEAIAAGVVAAFEEHDFALPLDRNPGAATARGPHTARALRRTVGPAG